MNIKTTFVTVSLLICAGHAMAEQIEAPTLRLVSGLTRAQVQNAAITARSRNDAVPSELYGAQYQIEASSETRKNIHAQAIASMIQHHSAMFNDAYLGG